MPVQRYTEPVTTLTQDLWRRVRPELLRECLEDGASLILDKADDLHGPLADFAAELEQWLHNNVQINVYASWTPQPGFGVHWDRHDVFVVQIDGSKRWRIYGPTRRRPLLQDVAACEHPQGDPVADIVMRPGDVLYLPRGWWHQVTADQGEPSLHVTAGVTPPHTAGPFVSWVVKQLQNSETFREDIPVLGTLDEQIDYLKRVRAELDRTLRDPRLVSCYAQAMDAAAPGRMRPSLTLIGGIPQDPDLMVKLTAPRTVARVVMCSEARDMVLRVSGAGNTVDLDADHAALLRRLQAGGWHRFGDLHDDLKVISQVVDDLVTAEIVTVRRP
ncbi:cupin domain-containing protein [Streptomyces sp. NPDC091278]|uniref:cupin domain-containing protein n=1 Tax=Streptomyces sp. NPDC091278 TaxID=3155301 RepID=UPI00344E0E3A